MAIFRVWYMTANPLAHVYCRIFVGDEPGKTFALAGGLTMRKVEFESFREAFKAEFLDGTRDNGEVADEHVQ